MRSGSRERQHRPLPGPCPPGAYNIVDGNPSPQHVWLTAFARTPEAPAPPQVSEEEALRTSGPAAVYYATSLRGASYERVRRELGFRPYPLEWIEANAREGP